MVINTSDVEWVESLEPRGLSNRALMLCSRFARELKRVDGRNLKLKDPKLPRKIGQVVRTTQSPSLLKIFQDLVIEFELLAEQRGEPRYRGSLISSSNNEPPYNQTAANDGSSTVKMYRGSVVQQGNKATNASIHESKSEPADNSKEPLENKGKQRMYRGVPID